MQEIHSNFYVLTGGPGTGKTSVLEELRKQGYICVEEVAREIIREQIEKGGHALPWDDIPAYTAEMLQRSVDVYRKYMTNSAICFFDRGIPDTYGYARLTNLPDRNSIRLITEQYRYNKKVFLFPFWEEIYCTDKERKQTVREAIETYQVLKETYLKLAYEVIEIPCMPVTERVGFILEQI